MLCAYLAYHISEYKSHNEFRVASYQCLPHNLACKGYKATIQWECVMPILRYLLIMLSLVLSKYELLCILSRCPNKAKPSSAEISSLLSVEWRVAGWVIITFIWSWLIQLEQVALLEFAHLDLYCPWDRIIWVWLSQLDNGLNLIWCRHESSKLFDLSCLM